MTKIGNSEYATFSTALKKVLRVSHSEMKAKIEAEKKTKRKPKTSAASRDHGA